MVSNDEKYLVMLGKAIAERRKSLQLTQSDLAYAIGMEIPNLSVIENGKSNPQLLTLVKISSALECELSDLLPPIVNHQRFIESPSKYKPRKHKA